ncbi:PEGA domain-containing protein [Azospirillum sp. TSO35-2]|uniref:PEGA domain-containing protein n=1 Tax=Azospirillum sp. TSO35-2 TaxID=716796 RepID=UPI000D6070A8|nr:PEGA domain-containing protein [Azospirillum sp. TSO35-2]PWC40963.1 hypothetical protein TSO352_00510 [Azospirillum sp. TSO35-2]
MTGARICTAPGCRKPLFGPVGWCPYCGAPQAQLQAQAEIQTPAAGQDPPPPPPGPGPSEAGGGRRCGKPTPFWRKVALPALAAGCIGSALLLGGAWLGLETLLPASRAGRATLTVLSDPPRGIVRIDGVERGYAPVTIEVTPGTLVQVSVVGISGRQPRSETVSLPAGESRTITLRLAPKLGGL